MKASCRLNPNKGKRAGQPALSRGLYTNVTECGCFSVHADKLFKVPGCHVIVPRPAAPTPPTPPLLLLTLCPTLFQPTVRQTQKQENAMLFSLSLFLGCGLSLPHFSPQPNTTASCGNKRRRRYCGDKQSWSAAKNKSWRRRATPPSFSPLCFSDPPLLSSSYSRSRSTYCHFLLFRFPFSKLWCVQ